MKGSLAKLVSAVVLVLATAAIATSQTAGGTLLRLQRSRMYLNVDTNAQHGMGMWGITYGNPGDVWNYPNSLSCLVVYSDGKYVLEKREEQTVGKPKVKLAEGTLDSNDLQSLKSIVEDEGFKKITSPKMPDLPADAQAIRELDSLDAQVDHNGTPQRFTTVKERVKTGALISATSGPSTGMDAYLDNSEAFKKQLAPLIKWFEAVEKKSKPELKESKPKYCAPMNFGG